MPDGPGRRVLLSLTVQARVLGAAGGGGEGGLWNLLDGPPVSLRGEPVGRSGLRPQAACSLSPSFPLCLSLPPFFPLRLSLMNAVPGLCHGWAIARGQVSVPGMQAGLWLLFAGNV